MRTCVHMENPLGYFNHPLRLHNFLQQELLNSHENHFERRKPIAIYVVAAKVFLVKVLRWALYKRQNLRLGLVWVGWIEFMIFLYFLISQCILIVPQNLKKSPTSIWHLLSNVWVKKIKKSRSSDTLLWFVSVFLTQTLNDKVQSTISEKNS